MNLTMTTLVDDGRSSTLVDHTPKGKKPCLNKGEHPNIEHSSKTPACISFHVSMKAGTKMP